MDFIVLEQCHLTDGAGRQIVFDIDRKREREREFANSELPNYVLCSVTVNFNAIEIEPGHIIIIKCGVSAFRIKCFKLKSFYGKTMGWLYWDGKFLR